MDAPFLTWTLDPSVVIGLAILATAYVVPLVNGTWRVSRFQTAAAVGTLGGMIVALVSPLDFLADHALFSAHMIQHILLWLPIPVLALFALPDEAFARIATVPALRAVLARLGQPLWAFLAATGAMWLWHTPAFYEAALHDDALHAFEHLSFLVTAALFWLPIVRPASGPSPFSELFQIVYLFGAAVSSTMLAALLTFASTILYPTYAQPGLPVQVHALLGISPLQDQQIGGLLMWVGSGAWYFVAAGVVFVSWFSRPSPDDSAHFDERLSAFAEPHPAPDKGKSGDTRGTHPTDGSPQRETALGVGTTHLDDNGVAQ